MQEIASPILASLHIFFIASCSGAKLKSKGEVKSAKLNLGLVSDRNQKPYMILPKIGLISLYSLEISQDIKLAVLRLV